MLLPLQLPLLIALPLQLLLPGSCCLVAAPAAVALSPRQRAIYSNVNDTQTHTKLLYPTVIYATPVT